MLENKLLDQYEGNSYEDVKVVEEEYGKKRKAKRKRQEIGQKIRDGGQNEQVKWNLCGTVSSCDVSLGLPPTQNFTNLTMLPPLNVLHFLVHCVSTT